MYRIPIYTIRIAIFWHLNETNKSSRSLSDSGPLANFRISYPSICIMSAWVFQ